MEKSVRDLGQIYNDMVDPIYKLKGIAELFYTEGTDGIMLSEGARNGIYYTLSGISDELQCLKDEFQFLDANKG